MKKQWLPKKLIALLAITAMCVSMLAVAPFGVSAAAGGVLHALTFEEGSTSDITYSFTPYAESLEEHKGTATIETDSLTGGKALKVVSKIGAEAISAGGNVDNLKFHIPALPEHAKKVKIQFDMRNEDFNTCYRAFSRFGMLTKSASNVYGYAGGTGTTMNNNGTCCSGSCPVVTNYYCGLGNNVWRRVIYTLDVENNKYEIKIYNDVHNTSGTTREHTNGTLGEFTNADGSIDLSFQTYFSEYGANTSYVRGDEGIYWIDNIKVTDAYSYGDDFENETSITRRIVANSTAVANGRGSTATVETDPTTGSKAMKFVSKLTSADGSSADAVHFTVPSFPSDVTYLEVSMDIRQEDNGVYKWWNQFASLGNVNGSGLRNYSLQDAMVHEAGGTTPTGYWDWKDGAYHHYQYLIDLSLDQAKFYVDEDLIWSGAVNESSLFNTDGTMVIRFNSVWSSDSGFATAGDAILWIDNLSSIGFTAAPVEEPEPGPDPEPETNPNAHIADFEGDSNIALRHVANATATENGRGSTATVETDPTTNSKAMKFVSKLTSADGSGADAVHFTIPAHASNVNFLEVSMDIRQENNGVWKWFEQFASLGNTNGSGLRNYSLTDIMVHEAGGTTPVGYWDWKDGVYHHYKYIIDLNRDYAKFFVDDDLIWSGTIKESSLFDSDGTMKIRFNSKWSGNSGFEKAGDAILWIDNISSVGSTVPVVSLYDADSQPVASIGRNETVTVNITKAVFDEFVGIVTMKDCTTNALKSVTILKQEDFADGALTKPVTSPDEDGAYYAEVYFWNALGKAKPLYDKLIFGQQ